MTKKARSFSIILDKLKNLKRGVAKKSFKEMKYLMYAREPWKLILPIIRGNCGSTSGRVCEL